MGREKVWGEVMQVSNDGLIGGEVLLQEVVDDLENLVMCTS